MPELFHQTARLSRGRHPSPAHGMCVMELASTLAGEPFSDHPRSVCPVIGAFLRTYNDRVDDVPRKDLIVLAAELVGTRALPEVEELRARAILEWAAERWAPTSRADAGDGGGWPWAGHRGPPSGGGAAADGRRRWCRGTRRRITGRCSRWCAG